MKRKYLILTLTILSTTVLMFTGCNENDDKTVPATSDAVVEEIPAEETEIETEEIDENTTDVQDGLSDGEVIDRETGNENVNEASNSDEQLSSNADGSDVDISGETEGNTTLTQEELEALKAQASDSDKIGFEAYESIMETGSWKNSGGGTCDKVVGTPGDTSWRRMTDEEAQAIIAKGRPASHWDDPEQDYLCDVAEAELSAGTWNGIHEKTVYFDFYKYKEAQLASMEADVEIDANGNVVPKQFELTDRF